MRSDFYGLPWAAQQAIRRGGQSAREATELWFSDAELRAKVAGLEKALAEANETIARLSAPPRKDIAE